MSKTVITLEEADLIDLQGILLDADEAAALTFLQARIAPNIPSKGTAKCDSSRRNPYLLQPDIPKKTRA
ncbi:MAG: hypothetical protein K9N23_11465 [Akkermansiaceae bacterium]|nr:hypothetical protein [Akkermansiaceae bacterium]MCF7732302.1 hypothetical protein [Akkermansiaceae bacterium]